MSTFTLIIIAENHIYSTSRLEKRYLTLSSVHDKRPKNYIHVQTNLTKRETCRYNTSL